MTRIGESDRIAASATSYDAAVTVGTAVPGSAVMLARRLVSRAPVRAPSTQGAGETPITDRTRSSAAAEIAAAFAGSPESLMARIAMEMRRTNSATKEIGIEAETSAADSADKAREAAEAAAAEAAEKATSFLGLGKTFDIVAKVVSAVVAVAATVVTFGSAAPLAAGLLLMTFGAELADLAVKTGLCPESMRKDLTIALKMTGAILVTAVSFGAGAAAVGSVALEASSDAIVEAAADAFDMSPEAKAALSITLTVAAAVLATVAGGAGGAGAGLAGGAGRVAIATLRDGARVVAAGAKIASAATDVGVAVANHEAAYSRIDAQVASTDRDAAYDRGDEQIEGLKSVLKAYGRALKLARQAQQARGQALQAATQQRA